MQKNYLALDKSEEEFRNWQYLLAVFHLVPSKEWDDLAWLATELAAESSTGSNMHVHTATPFAESMNAMVYRVDEEHNLVWLAYPTRIFDRGWNIQNIMTYIAWNIYWMSTVKACKLLDVWIPNAMLENYDGPNYTLDDMRKYLNVYDRPILWTIIKPKIGLTASEYAEVCYDFRVWGWDFVKNDEPQADQDFCVYKHMVKYVKEAMDKAVAETGRKKVHSFNVSASDFDTMIERCELIVSTFEPWSYAFLVDGITAGWMAIQTVRRRYPDVFLHFHRAGHGAFTRPENPIWFSVPILTKMARLAGSSGIHTGTAGVGKMKGDISEDVTAANQALFMEVEGHFFWQNRWKIPAKDKDMINIIKEDSAHHVVLEDDSWRGMKKTCPIVSWGLNPTKLPAFIDAIWHVDFITTMGAGVHAHPWGTQAGSKAQYQAGQAVKKWISLEEYAKDHKELAQAIEFYDKKSWAKQEEQVEKIVEA